MATWVLIIFYVSSVGGVSSEKVEGLVERTCKDQAIRFNESKVPVIALCVDKGR